MDWPSLESVVYISAKLEWWVNGEGRMSKCQSYGHIRPISDWCILLCLLVTCTLICKPDQLRCIVGREDRWCPEYRVIEPCKRMRLRTKASV
jgi:hypothetical protein